MSGVALRIFQLLLYLGNFLIKLLELRLHIGLIFLFCEGKFPDSRIVFAIDTAGALRFPVSDEDLKPAEGWTVAALTAEQPEDA